MNWSSTPPRISGWWFVGRKDGKKVQVYLVVVMERFGRFVWTFHGVDVWCPVDDFPKYKWAGPIHSPSLKNFNRAK